MRLTFKRLLIFSPVEELAKEVIFEDGLNIVTSSRTDGNDRGKSVIAKSLYHCMGADCVFDDEWEKAPKVYVIFFDVEGVSYCLARNAGVFKMFDADGRLIWSVSRRHELGVKMYEQFGFAIWLPNKNTGETEIAPPAYSYAPYFIDQNQYAGSEFESYKKMRQYSNYKADLLYTFTGAYDPDYFDEKARKSAVDTEINHIKESIRLDEAMLKRVLDDLGKFGHSVDMEALRISCSDHEEEYRNLAAILGSMRDKLYKLREDRSEIEFSLKSTEDFAGKVDKGLSMLNEEICPLCASHLDNTLAARVAICVSKADALLLADDIQKEFDDINRKIAQAEKKYKEVLSELDLVKGSMGLAAVDNMTAVQAEGLSRLEKGLESEIGALTVRLKRAEDRQKEISRKLRSYTDEKKTVDSRFVELVTAEVKKFDLREINLEQVKGLTSHFSASGSNRPLATLIWYLTLLRLKQGHNPSRIDLPLVLDSPLNIEADDQKFEDQYRLIFDEFRYDGQMIVTGLGLENSVVVPDYASVIVLKNEKYQLLSRSDYDAHKRVLFSVLEQH